MYRRACKLLPEMGGTFVPNCIMAHAGFPGDGIESGPLCLISLMSFDSGFMTLNQSIKRFGV